MELTFHHPGMYFLHPWLALWSSWRGQYCSPWTWPETWARVLEKSRTWLTVGWREYTWLSHERSRILLKQVYMVMCYSLLLCKTNVLYTEISCGSKLRKAATNQHFGKPSSLEPEPFGWLGSALLWLSLSSKQLRAVPWQHYSLVAQMLDQMEFWMR